MQVFHYNYIKKKYGDTTKMLLTALSTKLKPNRLMKNSAKIKS